MTKPYEGKVALVTGSTSGIGKACALALAASGARVVVSGRREVEGEEVVAAIRADGGEAMFIRADMASRDDIEALIQRTVEAWGRLDYAVNNAGIEGPRGVPMADYLEQDWDDVMNVNLKGMWLCMKYQIPHLLQQQGSSIVNMSSVAGFIGGSLGAAYHASKHGIIGLTKTAAIEYASKGLRINAVAPASIETEMSNRLFQDPAIMQKVVEAHPLLRIGTVEEVASAVVWLCGAGFVTGHVIPVDGGLLAR